MGLEAGDGKGEKRRHRLIKFRAWQSRSKVSCLEEMHCFRHATALQGRWAPHGVGQGAACPRLNGLDLYEIRAKQ